MAWVKQQQRPDHNCNMPQNTWGDPVGMLGDMWRCDKCGIVWKIKMVRIRITRLGETVKSKRTKKAWRVANFIAQMLYGGLPEEGQHEADV